MIDKALQEEIGRRIKDLRETFHYSQAQVAELMDISEVHFRNMEAGRKGVTIEQLLKLKKIFHVTLDYLIVGDVENPEVGKLSALIAGSNESLYPYIKDAVVLLMKLEQQMGAGE